ncbi:MAG: hypothetical protein WBP45_03230 [Daejeonella sp.]
MSNIEIKDPLDLKIEFLEFDERQYSIKLFLNYFVVVFQKKLIEINNQLWVECKMWDEFILNIYKMKIRESKVAKLYSMSDELILELFKEEDSFSFILHYNRYVNPNVNINSSISSTLNVEQLDYLYRHLNSFDKCW